MIADTDAYRSAFAAAREHSALVRSMTSAVEELPSTCKCFVSDDGLSGFAINGDELVGVFSLVKGRGEALVLDAIANGAKRLDCFDGYLPGFYSRFGFREINREPNWTPGGPDVVFMALA